MSLTTEHHRLFRLLEWTIPQTAATLAAKAGIKDKHATSPRTRRFIRDLIEAGKPIVVSQDGYRLGTSDELVEQASHLLRRAARINQRAQWLLDTALGRPVR